uniref:Uncharacterized protein n=1 Tax=Micrurus lemniscatus lemniscatus TaxID=129467 RepID=A0A2D4I4T3_MICLE
MLGHSTFVVHSFLFFEITVVSFSQLINMSFSQLDKNKLYINSFPNVHSSQNRVFFFATLFILAIIATKKNLQSRDNEMWATVHAEQYIPISFATGSKLELAGSCSSGSPLLI